MPHDADSNLLLSPDIARENPDLVGWSEMIDTGHILRGIFPWRRRLEDCVENR